MRLPCAVVLLASWPATVVAQETGAVLAREVHAFPVKVVGADGRPVEGAEVVLLAVHRLVPEFGALDVVRGRTDANGRARVELRSGLEYRAWATTVDAASPTVAVEAGRQIELRLAAAKQTLHVDGLEAWSAYGPVRVRVWIHGVAGLCADLPIEKGDAVLPPLPSDALQYGLVDKGGTLLQGRSFDPPRRVAPPVELHARVVDEQGKPVAGAAITQTFGVGRRSDLPLSEPEDWDQVLRAVTGADGTATLRVASPKDPWAPGQGGSDLHFVATKDGCAATFSGFFTSIYFDGHKVDENERAPKELRFTLRKAEPRTGRVVAPATAMPKQIVLLGETLIEQEGGSSSHSLRTTVAVGADGTFALPALAIGQWRSAFVPAPPPPPGTDPEDLFVHARSLPALRVQLGTDARIDLGGAQALRLQFAAADNTPCSGAWVIAVVPPDSAGGFQEFVPLGRTDELGRFAATLPPDEWVLFVYDDAGSVLLTFDPVANAGKPLQLVREPFACMRLQVVDQAGKPVGGARAKVSEMIGMGRNARIEQARGDIAGRIDSWQMEKARSDAEGRLDLRYLPTPRGQVTFRLEVERGGEQHRSNRTLMDDRGATTQVVIQ